MAIISLCRWSGHEPLPYTGPPQTCLSLHRNQSHGSLLLHTHPVESGHGISSGPLGPTLPLLNYLQLLWPVWCDLSQTLPASPPHSILKANLGCGHTLIEPPHPSACHRFSSPHCGWPCPASCVSAAVWLSSTWAIASVAGLCWGPTM